MKAQRRQGQLTQPYPVPQKQTDRSIRNGDTQCPYVSMDYGLAWQKGLVMLDWEHSGFQRPYSDSLTTCYSQIHITKTQQGSNSQMEKLQPRIGRCSVHPFPLLSCSTSNHQFLFTPIGLQIMLPLQRVKTTQHPHSWPHCWFSNSSLILILNY